MNIAWHHYRGTVPDGWEVSLYSIEDRLGRIEFATRNGLEGTLSWEPCEREPDKQTTMTSFLANNILGKKEAQRRGLRPEDVHTDEVGEFVLGWLEEDMPLQALAYDRTGRSLVRWIFEGHTSAKHRREIIAPILRSVSFNEDPDVREYNLFGIHANLPTDYKLEYMAALPAAVAMTFEGDESHARVSLRRWGLAETLVHRRGLEGFYRSVAQRAHILIDSCEAREVEGCEGLFVRYSAPREFHGDRFMARRWNNGIAYVRHDREANRIFAFEQIGPKDYGQLPLSTVLFD